MERRSRPIIVALLCVAAVGCSGYSRSDPPWPPAPSSASFVAQSQERGPTPTVVPAAISVHGSSLYLDLLCTPGTNDRSLDRFEKRVSILAHTVSLFGDKSVEITRMDGSPVPTAGWVEPRWQSSPLDGVRTESRIVLPSAMLPNGQILQRVLLRTLSDTLEPSVPVRVRIRADLTPGRGLGLGVSEQFVQLTPEPPDW